jgi:hypothetical protein
VQNKIQPSVVSRGGEDGGITAGYIGKNPSSREGNFAANIRDFSLGRKHCQLKG